MKTRPWIDVSELRDPHNPEAENAVLAASLVLFMLSGQRFTGSMTTTEQYVCEATGAPVGCVWDSGANTFWNPVVGAYVYTGTAAKSRSRYSVGGDFRLNHRPVTSIDEITIGGETVDPSQYRLLNRAILHPSTAVAWGLCSSPVVTYTYGLPPPMMGKLAARAFANELVLAFNGEECSLPSSVTSVDRQGLSFSIFDPKDFLDKGRVGLYEVDLFLQAVNPSRAAKRPRVFSPDMPRPYRSS